MCGSPSEFVDDGRAGLNDAGVAALIADRSIGNKGLEIGGLWIDGLASRRLARRHPRRPPRLKRTAADENTEDCFHPTTKDSRVIILLHHDSPTRQHLSFKKHRRE